MRPIWKEKCFNHAAREAAVLCLECKKCFCRECVAEHAKRFLCVQCLKKATARVATGPKGFLVTRRALALSAGLLCIWLFFYACGQVLLLTPTRFHEGTFWLDELQELDDANDGGDR